jgi:hypothetical protein
MFVYSPDLVLSEGVCCNLANATVHSTSHQARGKPPHGSEQHRHGGKATVICLRLTIVDRSGGSALGTATSGAANVINDLHDEAVRPS